MQVLFVACKVWKIRSDVLDTFLILQSVFPPYLCFTFTSCLNHLQVTRLDIGYSVQFSSVAQSCPTLCNPMNHSMPGLPVHHQLLEFTQTHVHPVGDAISHLILCHPLLPLPPIPPNIRGFSNESTLQMMWPKYWSSASASVLPMNTHN